MITLDITIVNIALPSLQAAGIIAVGAIAVAVVMNTPRPSRQAAADHADLHALG